MKHQPDATIFQFIILTFIYSSNMFRAFSRPSSGVEWLQWQSLVKPKAAKPEICLAVNKRQDNKLENCCIWLMIYLKCTMMHGITNLKP
jgi:hypothetical protein